MYMIKTKDCNTKKKVDGAWEQVIVARDMGRIRSLEIIHNVFDEFIELHGDRRIGDDRSIIAGIGLMGQYAVTIIGQQKGNNSEEMRYHHYGMTQPHGYRKALRLMRQAEKFNQPVICLIDTPGAFPGISAEKNGQAEAIASNLYEMINLTVPIISIVIGEGGSGGALALGVANKLYMLENAIFSVVSPEVCASILYKDTKRAPEAAQNLKLTANDLKNYGIIDEIIRETGEKSVLFRRIRKKIVDDLQTLLVLDKNKIKRDRFAKFRNMGSGTIFINSDKWGIIENG